MQCAGRCSALYFERKGVGMSFTEGFKNTDPEYAAIIENFLQEAANEKAVALPERTRHLAIVAALLGCQGLEAFRVEVPQALAAGVNPVELKEVVYQATDYLGLGRVLPFINVMNEALEAAGVELPLEGQATVTSGTRLEAGNGVQIEAFGEGMRETWKSCPPERVTVNRWLAANCFGDYYTRGGLTLAEREMVTFCYIAAQGGCDPQATAHAAGNMGVGNSKEFMYAVVHQMLPFIGYPRSLNALSCIDAAVKAQ